MISQEHVLNHQEVPNPGQPETPEEKKERQGMEQETEWAIGCFKEIPNKRAYCIHYSEAEMDCARCHALGQNSRLVDLEECPLEASTPDELETRIVDGTFNIYIDLPRSGVTLDRVAQGVEVSIHGATLCIGVDLRMNHVDVLNNWMLVDAASKAIEYAKKVIGDGD